jgi:hypothetical protein
LLLGSATVSRLNALAFESAITHETSRRVAREAVQAAAGVQLLLGLGSLTLGILAVVGILPLVLTLVGLLTTGAAVVFSGTAIASRMMTVLTSK